MSSSDRHPRRLAGAAMLVAGVAFGVVLAPAAGIRAADGNVAALEARIAKLEELLVPRIGADGKAQPAQGGVVLRAPFTIVDSSNAPVFTVTATTGGAAVVVGDSAGQHYAEMSVGSGDVTIAAHEKDVSASLKAAGPNGYLMTEGAKGNTELGQSDIGMGLFINGPNGDPLADLSQPEGGNRGMALRVYAQGQPAAQLGVAPGTGGLMRLIASGEKVTVQMDSMPDGTGMVKVRGDSDENGVTLDGKGQFVKLQGQAGVAVLGKDQTDWGLAIKDSGGSPKASVSDQSGKVGLRVYDAGKEVVYGGAEPGKGGTVTIYSPGSSGAVASLEVNGDGSGSVQASTASGGKGLRLDAEKKALFIDTDQGTATLGDNGGWGLYIGQSGGQPLADLAQPEGQTMALRVYASGQRAVEIGSSKSGGGSADLFGTGGDKPGISLRSTGEGTGMLQVSGRSDSSRVTLDGEKALLSVDGDEGSADLGAGGSGWGLMLGDRAGTPQAALTQPSGKGMALRFLNGGSQVAAIGHLPGEGGAVYVFSENGAPAGAMDVFEGGGNVRVYGTSRQPVAALAGKANAVEVYNSTGAAVAALKLAQTGSGGKVSAGDPNGAEVFKGGYDPDGPGGACVSRKGWKCLGIGLTGMEGFH
jgi:hypothetical protein